MYSFFILGQIPGTGIVISFTMWMILCAAGLMTMVWLQLRRHTQQPLLFEPTIGSDDSFSTAL